MGAYHAFCPCKGCQSAAEAYSAFENKDADASKGIISSKGTSLGVNGGSGAVAPDYEQAE